MGPFFKSSVLKSEENTLTLSALKLKQYHPAVQRRLIRMALECVKGNLKKMTFGHVDSIMELLNHGRGRRRLDLPGRIMTVYDGDCIVFSREKRCLRNIKWGHLPDTPFNFCYHLTTPGHWTINETKTELTISEMGIENMPVVGSAGQQVAFFDIKKIHFPLVLRNWVPKDRFTPLGMKGTKTVHQFLKDRKIAAGQRCDVPVLLSGKKIIGVLGFQIDDDVKITASTEKVLEIRMHPCLSGIDD
jgi:tRNA(Ile)-lysidine synthase